MQLRSMVLQHFRSYLQKKFDFDEHMTIIIGPNTAGKTNCVEAIMLLATGKSFRAEKDIEMISFGQEIARVQGLLLECHPDQAQRVEGSVQNSLGKKDSSTSLGMTNSVKLDVTLAYGSVTGGRFVKKFAVNDISKSRNSFVGFLPAVLFRPEELDIVIAGPSIRRSFLDSVLEQVSTEYRSAKITYDKALRSRNALLAVVRETGKKDKEQFAYWDDLLIRNGEIITTSREEFIAYMNQAEKSLFQFSLLYDKSILSRERLLAYENAEIASGNTLVGPQRDDILFFMKDTSGLDRNVEQFGSRGQQRLVVLQLKLLQMRFIEECLENKPLLILDDIFSELDNSHIAHVLDHVQGRQVIITTTHEEFVNGIKNQASVIKLTQER